MLDKLFTKQTDKRFTLMQLSSEGDGKTKKCPINVRTGGALSWKKNPEDLLTWDELNALETIKQISADPSLPIRVGVLLTENWIAGKELICIDLDHVPDLVAQARQGKITDTSQQGIILQMALEHGFYVEVSQSGEGLHLFTLGHKADTNKIRNDLFEYYDRGRWITLTGDAIAYYTGEKVDLEPFEKVMWPNEMACLHLHRLQRPFLPCHQPSHRKTSIACLKRLKNPKMGTSLLPYTRGTMSQATLAVVICSSLTILLSGLTATQP